MTDEAAAKRWVEANRGGFEMVACETDDTLPSELTDGQSAWYATIDVHDGRGDLKTLVVRPSAAPAGQVSKWQGRWFFDCWAHNAGEAMGMAIEAFRKEGLVMGETKWVPA